MLTPISFLVNLCVPFLYQYALLRRAAGQAVDLEVLGTMHRDKPAPGTLY